MSDLRGAVEALADEWEQDYPSSLAACNREPDEWWLDLRAILAADAAPTPSGDECNCGYGGVHEPLNRRCAAFDPNHPDVVPAPVAAEPTGGVGLTAEERALGTFLAGLVDGAVDELAAEILRSDWFAARLATARAEGAREHRVEWADYLDDWRASVGPQPPTVDAIIDALRHPEPPFGRSANDRARGADGGASRR